MLNIVIIEDEQPAIEKLLMQLSLVSTHKVVGTYRDPIAFLNSGNNGNIDLLFVDINLPSINGMALALKLKATGFMGAIIFTTAHSKFAVDAFTLGAVDYLLKPYNNERLSLALSRVDAIASTPVDIKLPSKVAGKIVLIDTNRIDVIKLEFGQAYAYCADQHFPLEGSLDELQAQLPARFLRVHRDTIINQEAIASFERWVTGGYLVKLRGSNQQVITSRNGAKLLKQQLIN